MQTELQTLIRLLLWSGSALAVAQTYLPENLESLRVQDFEESRNKYTVISIFVNLG